MREHVAAALLLVMVALAMAAPLASAQGLSWTRETWVLLPAVYGTQGMVTNVTVTLTYPGTGQVSVTDNSGQVGSSTLYSVEMAYMVAMAYAGLNWRNYNLYVHFNVSGPIEGPSGSFGVMLAVLALATGLDVNSLHHFAITGAVSPSGLSGPIGGLQYKCEAAASEGLGIVYPVGNMPSASGGCNDSRAVPVAGVVQALSEVFGAYPYTMNVSVPAPRQFNEVMVNVTDYFIEDTVSALQQVSSSASLLRGSGSFLRYQVERFVNESERDLAMAREYLASMPYAAASFAFTAYVNALAANYTLWALRVSNSGGSLAGFLKSQASDLYSRASAMMANAELYANRSYSLTFAELMATAFARLADSLYFSSYAASLASQVNVTGVYVPAYYLALAKARILGAIGWLMAANATVDEGVNLTPALVAATAEAVGGYADTVLNYAGALISYYVQQLESIGDVADAEALQAMENDLRFLVNYGDSLLSQGQYLAAIGVYEDALTNALNVIFVESGSFSSRAVNLAYAAELNSEYAVLAAALARSGLLSSLDSAYMSYASALLPSDPQDAIYIMETAVIDELSWYLGLIQYGQAQPEVISQIISPSSGLVGTVVIALAALAAGATLAASVALWSYRRTLRSLSPTT